MAACVLLGPSRDIISDINQLFFTWEDENCGSLFLCGQEYKSFSNGVENVLLLQFYERKCMKEQSAEPPFQKLQRSVCFILDPSYSLWKVNICLFLFLLNRSLLQTSGLGEKRRRCHMSYPATEALLWHFMFPVWHQDANPACNKTGPAEDRSKSITGGEMNCVCSFVSSCAMKRMFCSGADPWFSLQSQPKIYKPWTFSGFCSKTDQTSNLVAEKTTSHRCVFESIFPPRPSWSATEFWFCPSPCNCSEHSL